MEITTILLNIVEKVNFDFQFSVVEGSVLFISITEQGCFSSVKFLESSGGQMSLPFKWDIAEGADSQNKYTDYC